MTGTPPRTCVNCGAPLSAGAQFCHACGAPQRRAASRQPPLPWLVVGGLIVVIVVAIVSYSVGRSAGRTAVAGGATSAEAGMGAAPDISNMSPSEQAERLFELVMTAHEQGNVQRMNQFLPMALQAYEMLGTLNADQHYHVGLMDAISGNVQGALAQVDTIRTTEPDHLLATMLRYSVAQLQGDSAAAQAALRKFNQDYTGEMAKNLPEYGPDLHGRSIESFHTQAQSASGGS